MYKAKISRSFHLMSGLLLMSISSKFRSFVHEFNVVYLSRRWKYLTLDRKFKMEDRVNLSNISITKNNSFFATDKRKKKSLRGCRRYVSWNIGSIVNGVFWKKKRNRNKQQQHKTRFIIRVFQCIHVGREVAKYNHPKDDSLQCRCILGGGKLLVCVRFVVAARHLWFYDRGRLGRESKTAKLTMS